MININKKHNDNCNYGTLTKINQFNKKPRKKLLLNNKTKQELFYINEYFIKNKFLTTYFFHLQNFYVKILKKQNIN